MSRYVLLSTLLLMTSVIAAHSQTRSDSSNIVVIRTPNKPNPWFLWGTLGVGAVGPGIGGLFRLTYQWDAHSSVSAKLEGGSEFNIWGPSNDVSEGSIYYGYSLMSTYTIARVAAGPAYFERTDHALSFTRFGLGFEAEGMLKYKFVGLGVMFTYMYAKDISFPGLTINLSVGKLE